MYIDKFMFLCFYFFVFILISCCANKNKELNKLSWGKAAYDYLSVELFFFMLFAQYYVIIAILIVLAAIIFSVWFHRHIAMHCDHRRRKYHNRASAVICLLLCIVLAVPSFIGIYKEYFSFMMTFEEWEEFAASFKIDYGGKVDAELFEKYDAVIEELKLWDELNTDERVVLLRKVALIEKENLGIESAEFIVTNDKLGKYTCGYYSAQEQEMCLSISEISGDSLEENINTVCHEVFHAYEYYVVENIDFNSEMVQNNFYFENARKWRDNINKYVPGIIDYNMYLDQPVEKDARQYAEDRVNAYIEKLNSD